MSCSTPSRLCLALALASLLLTACSPDQPEPVAAAPETAPLADPEPESEAAAPPAREVPEVVVIYGRDEMIPWLESQDWWGEVNREEQLTVPRVIITAIHPSWQEYSAQLQVRDKKALFYRLMLPLVMHANSMVLEFRGGLEAMRETHASGGKITPEQLTLLKRLAGLLPDMTAEDVEALTANHPEMDDMIDALLYRLDVVPPGLALGQAAYESGYGTSRFAVEGNSLFGQWTYGGEGLVPKQQRKSTKGDHRIKAFEWPFDSVRGYFINLMSHPAYEDFRRLRAETRAAGKPFESLELANGLLRYSERGQEYVDSLKGMIRTNGLDIADHAVFRDEPMRFLLSEESPEQAEAVRAEIERMRQTGELVEIFQRMRLE